MSGLIVHRPFLYSTDYHLSLDLSFVLLMEEIWLTITWIKNVLTYLDWFLINSAWNSSLESVYYAVFLQLAIYKEDFENERKDKLLIKGSADSLKEQLHTALNELRMAQDKVSWKAVNTVVVHMCMYCIVFSFCKKGIADFYILNEYTPRWQSPVLGVDPGQICVLSSANEDLMAVLLCTVNATCYHLSLLITINCLVY